MSDDINAIEIVNRPTRPLLDERALAELLDVSVRTLQAQRQRGDGIPFIKLGAA